MTEEISKPAAPAGEIYDDRPYVVNAADLPEEIRSPLKPFKGEKPPAPQWFRDAIAQEPERRFVTSAGARIELLTWGEIGKPGLLLVHGNSAHADWWSFIAPFLATEYRVAAMTLAGMGPSDWRDSYAPWVFAEDAEACAQAAGLYADGRAPVYIGHSFGAAQVFHVAVNFPEQLRAAIFIDCGFGPVPSVLEERAQRTTEERLALTRQRPTQVYPTLEAALARFRLAPPQPCENLYIVDHIARRSLKRAPLADGSGEGWTWCFDPNIWAKLDFSRTVPHGQPVSSFQTPMIHFLGEHSQVMERRQAGDSRPPAGLTEIMIPDSHHHVMIDQPLALVAALRTALTLWA